MITLGNIGTLDQKIRSLMKNVDGIYYLSADEGGMMGNPKFHVSTSRKLLPYFERIGKMSTNSIKNYILGRLTSWQIGNNKDYSEVFTLTVDTETTK
jgi:hypothetical protein